MRGLPKDGCRGRWSIRRSSSQLLLGVGCLLSEFIRRPRNGAPPAAKLGAECRDIRNALQLGGLHVIGRNAV